MHVYIRSMPPPPYQEIFTFHPATSMNSTAPISVDGALAYIKVGSFSSSCLVSVAARLPTDNTLLFSHER